MVSKEVIGSEAGEFGKFLAITRLFKTAFNRLPIFLPSLLLLAGCGNYYSVKIPYYLPENRNIIETRKALSALYIAVKAPPLPEESALGGVLGNPGSARRPELDTYNFARKVAQVFSRPGISVKACRVFRTEEDTDPYMRYFSPSGLLALEISDLSVSAKKEVRSSVYYDKNKQKQTIKTAVWVYSASIRADVRLLLAADMRTLDKISETFSYVEDRSDGNKNAAEWYEENEARLVGAATARLSDRYIGKQTLRMRPLFRKKDDPESSRAADLARRGGWGEAEVVWTRRLKNKEDWRDMMDLGVSAEVRKDYPAARDYYVRAREASSGDKEARPVRWDEILGDLEVMLSTGSAAQSAGDDWFAPALAVLPFADETTSIDGPPMLRTLIHAALTAAGYRVQALEDTDRILLSHGLSQGGQLGAADRAEICKWLGVERLFYGDISEFSEVTAGIYNRRMIKGQTMLWDLKAGDFIWGLNPSVIRVSTARSFLGGMFSQLAKGLIERIKNKPLAYESSLFAARAAEALPNKIK
ncbi:MAG TPA: hypothetical protein DEF68_03770 [Elusimicrobia bacterium]|nr:hypothetical protein [Elusimicrobiota bacterium]HBW22480.1 hypothetical protein [Elusimicrobiota bacterium]